MPEKKVVIVIVEGPSQESALGSLLKEYFSSDETYFVVTHGDITSRNDVDATNVVSKVMLAVDTDIGKYGYHWDDLVRIIHIADTDGAFTNGCIVKADVENIQYFEDHIESANVTATERRNKNKADAMYKLCTTKIIHHIDYRLYFNSCNLEHVLFNALKDFSDDEKTEMSDDFADKYDGHIDDFIEFISAPDVAVQGTYKDTWKFIGKDRHSLERHSNMHLIFDK